MNPTDFAHIVMVHGRLTRVFKSSESAEAYIYAVCNDFVNSLNLKDLEGNPRKEDFQFDQTDYLGAMESALEHGLFVGYEIEPIED
jgi:hypothetical protein